MGEKTCKALKLNKQRCTRPALKDSEYCWQHILSRLDDARWYNSAKIQAYIGLIGLVLAVVFFTYNFAFGPTKSNQKKILQKLADIDKKFTETIPPVLTKEDAERPLSVEGKKLLVEYEKWKLIADQANVKAQLSLDAQLSHADALFRLADYKSAETAYRTILVGHPDNTNAMNGLGLVLHQMAKCKEAEELFREVLSKDEASFGPDHPDVAIRLNNLASLLQDTNRLAEAEPLYRRALSIKKESLGTNHPGYATSLNDLANLLKDTNRLSEAEPLYHRVLQIYETSFGPNHPWVATALNNLAGLLLATNRFSEAEPLYQRALKIGEDSFGPDHPKVAIRLNNLAELLRETGRFDEAEPMYRRALKIDEKSFGPDHPKQKP